MSRNTILVVAIYGAVSQGSLPEDLKRVLSCYEKPYETTRSSEATRKMYACKNEIGLETVEQVGRSVVSVYAPWKKSIPEGAIKSIEAFLSECKSTGQPNEYQSCQGFGLVQRRETLTKDLKTVTITLRSVK